MLSRIICLYRFLLTYILLLMALGSVSLVMAQDTDSGIPDQVWSVSLEGNKQYPAVVLKSQIATNAPTFWEKLQFWNRTGHELDEVQVKKDVIRLRNYYQRRGFARVEVDYRIETKNEPWKKVVIFEIQEQLPIRIQTVEYELNAQDVEVEEIRKNQAFQDVQQSQAYKEGKRYETLREPEVIGQFTDVFKNIGFAFAEVSIEAKVDTTKMAAHVKIIGNLGPRTYIDHIEVEGANTISKNYVLREAELQRKDMYSLDKLQEAQKQLFNHHLFRFATISIPEQPQDSTLDLLMRVREREKRSLELLAGFGTEEKLRGQMSWTNRNVAHRGHRFTATAHASFIEQTLRLDYLFPYFYNTKSSFVISPFGQHLLENNYELLRAGVTNSFIYQYDDNLTSSATYEFTKNQELSQRFDDSLPDTTLEYDLSSFKFTGYYNETFGRRQEGWIIQPYVELSGLFGLASFQFQKVSADIRRFTRLSNSTMLATRVQGGALYNVPSDSLPNNIRYYLGGTNSVRGWYRQELGPKRALTNNQEFQEYVPLGGRAMLGFNIELRQDVNFLFDGFGIAAFLDGGQVWRTFRRMENRPLQFGTGGGLRYQSPLGPVRVDIGYKINPTDRDLNRYNGQDFGSAWDRIGIHFSIGQAF